VERGAWKAARVAQLANVADPFLVSSRARRGTIPSLAIRFRTACKVLGAERLDGLTIHHGRHTFISHALAGGRTLAEVRDAAGPRKREYHEHVPARGGGG
jgi:integrase